MSNNLADQQRLGAKIRALRRQRSWNQERLAELAQTSTKHIGEVERGQVDVGLAVFQRIAAALSVTAASLIDGSTNATGSKSLFTADELSALQQTIHLLERLKSYGP